MQNYDTAILTEAEKFTSLSLTKKDDLVQILTACKADKNYNLFEELCFTGKYVNGLFKVLKTGNSNPEINSLDHIKKDLSDNIQKVISQLREITLNSVSDVRNKFNDQYFSLNPESLNNLKELCSDLDIVKKYLNHLKRVSGS
ncbi:MAG: hypothetical protein R6W68_15340 [Ignavibacteriaceae bacterium]